MKKKIIFTLLFTYIFISIGFTADWTGFRDLKWGSSPTKDMRMVEFDKKSNNKFYEKRSEKLSIGQADLTRIIYGYYRDQLDYVVISFKGYTNFIYIKDTYFSTFGEGYKHNRFMDEYGWFNRNGVDLMLSYSKITDKGQICYFYRPIIDQSNNEMKQKSIQGEKDL